MYVPGSSESALILGKCSDSPVTAAYPGLLDMEMAWIPSLTARRHIEEKVYLFCPILNCT